MPDLRPLLSLWSLPGILLPHIFPRLVFSLPSSPCRDLSLLAAQRRVLSPACSPAVSLFQLGRPSDTNLKFKLGSQPVPPPLDCEFLRTRGSLSLWAQTPGSEGHSFLWCSVRTRRKTHCRISVCSLGAPGEVGKCL